VSITAQEDKRVGLIIAQQDVIARLIQLNIVVLKQQRFCLGMRNGDINILDECDQRFGLTGGKVAAKILERRFLRSFAFPT
jgi:hypothetical protein